MSREELLHAFIDLFPGSRESHSVLRPPFTKNEKGKVKGQYVDLSGPATIDDYRRHLNGEVYLTLKPGGPDAKFWWASNDVDDLASSAADALTQRMILDLPINIYPKPSKSGGIHGFIFFAEPQERTTIHNLFRMWNDELGLPLKTEVFPKEVSEGRESQGLNLLGLGRLRRRARSCSSSGCALYGDRELPKP